MNGPLRVVVWDNIGNTMLGMRPWDEWDSDTQARFLAEDPGAPDRIVSLDDLFESGEIELTWLYDPEASRRGFAAFIDEHGTILQDQRDRPALVETIASADVLITHKVTVPSNAIAAADHLKLVQHLGLDYRGLPIATLREKACTVTATPLINYSAVAEQGWATILALLKCLPDQQRYMSSGEYQNGWGAYHPGTRILSDLTIGFVGMGEIARPMARIARAFGMRVLYRDILRMSGLESSIGIEMTAWDEIWKQSDVVSLQLALTNQTTEIVRAREFDWMKPDAIFQNSARGKLVDETALIDALVAGKIGGAALDVYFEEPLPFDSPLIDLHNRYPGKIILTPHSAAQGPWTWVRDSQELWLNVRRLLDEAPILHVI